MNENEPVSVYTTHNPAEAEILRNYLESEGIKCDLDGENQGSLASLLDINLLVCAWDEEKARKALASHPSLHAWRSGKST